MRPKVLFLEASSSFDLSRIASNPFLQSSFLEFRDSVSGIFRWIIKGHPDALVTIVSAVVNVGGELEGSVFHIEMSLRQGERVVDGSVELKDFNSGKIGTVFENDGSDYSIEYRISSNAIFKKSRIIEICPLAWFVPIWESDRPALFQVEQGGERCLVSCNQGGLMNRMVPLMSCAYLGRNLGLSVFAWWGANNHCAAHLDDIFENVAASDATFLAPTFDFYENYDFSEPLDLFGGSRIKLVHSINPLRTQNPEIVTSFFDAGQEFLRYNLHPKIAAKLVEFPQDDFSKTIGLHLRRPYASGLFADQENAKFTLNTEFFTKLISEFKRQWTKFDRLLLCTNSAETEKELTERFGDYILVFQKESYDNTSESAAVQDAVVDLMLMSRCPILFSQETTAFGRFAHAIGNNRYLALTQQSSLEQLEIYVHERADHVETLHVQMADLASLEPGASLGSASLVQSSEMTDRKDLP